MKIQNSWLVSQLRNKKKEIYLNLKSDKREPSVQQVLLFETMNHVKSLNTQLAIT